MSYVCWCGVRRVGAEAEGGKERRKTRGERKRRDRETVIKDPQKSRFLCLVCLHLPRHHSASHGTNELPSERRNLRPQLRRLEEGQGGQQGAPGQAIVFYFFETVSRSVTPVRSMFL